MPCLQQPCHKKFECRVYNGRACNSRGNQQFECRIYNSRACNSHGHQQFECRAYSNRAINSSDSVPITAVPSTWDDYIRAFERERGCNNTVTASWT